jgi:hypothetical protein
VIVICLNGSINSGKTTIGRALAAALPDAAFIDGDDHDAPDNVEFDVMLDIALSRLEREIAGARVAHLVIAYPLRNEDHARLAAAAAARGARLFVATLAPPLDVALADRGERKLDDEERQRIRQMYDEGYADRSFSRVILRQPAAPAALVQTLRAAIEAF